MMPDISWLIGLHLLNVEKKDFTWFFTLDDASTIATEAHWRFITERVVVTSEDHGHLFGLTTPVNAASVITETLGQRSIERFALDDRTGDLSLDFVGGGTIQFLTMSGGYEGWRIRHKDHLIICLGGGELAFLSD